MKKFIASLLLTIIFTCSYGQSKDQSLLWEISGNGLEFPSYLYGTMHVSNKIAFHLADSFFIALDNSDIIALESDPGEWMEEMFASKSAMVMNGYSKYLHFDYDKNFYEGLTDFEEPDKKTLMAALRDKHSLQNGFLYRGSLFEDEYEESTYLDLFIYQYGKKNGIKVVNLEEHEQTNILQIKSMIPDEDEDEEEKKKKKKKKKNYYSQWNEDMTVREALEEAYRNGEVNVIDSIMKMTAHSDNYMKYFLYDRNRIMARGMDSLMKNNKIFVGIGAAHLAGKEGVIQMMKDYGYNVRPVSREITDFAKKKKEKIEETFLSIPFLPRTTNDGYISVNVPGKLFETPGKRGDIQYFYPEMTNGGYFFIRRFNTYSPVHKGDENKWQDKLDSLLFENIEGKIIEEREITVSGYPAKDVLNKTRKGDFQRRLIIYTPLEIIFFKMSGTGKWVKEYGDNFFSSIKLNTKEVKQQLYHGHLGDFEITFPSPPIHNVHAEKLYDAPRHCIQSYSQSDSSYYVLLSSKINDTRYIEEDSFEVRFLIKTLFEQLDSADVAYIKLDSIVGKSATGKATHENAEIYAKAILHRNFYFLLMVKGNQQQAEAFFSSFKYKDEFKEEEYFTYKDTILNYTVTTPIAPEKLEDILFSVRQQRRNKNKDDWNTVKARRYFDYDNTKESFSVHCYKFNDYFQKESMDEFWEDELKPYTKNDMITQSRIIDNNDTVPTAHLILADTNSTKIIEVKKYLNQGVLFTIKSSYDSLSPKSKFVSTFFETFTPTRDTLLGKHVLASSADLFFDDLRSLDSLQMKKAVELVNQITFEERHIDSMVWYIRNFEFPEDDEEGTKVYLIRELGYIESNLAIKPLASLYNDSDEDHEEQFAALKGLAKISNKQSYKVMTNLMIDNPPIATSSSSISHLFNYFDDSLKLSKKMYPKVWDLMLYDKYRSPIYNLSVTMMDSSLIKAKSYKKMKPLILRKAKSLVQKKSSYDSSVKLSGRDYFYKNGKRVDHNSFIIDQFSVTKYLKLLAPYYEKDKSVHKFFDKIFQSDNNRKRFITTVIFTQNKLNVPDSVMKVLSTSQTYQYPLYKELSTLNKTSLFDESLLSQEKMAKSILYAGSTSIDEEEDSITFVKSIQFTESESKGNLYFYKSESSYGSKWYIHYAGIMSLDTTEISTDIDFDFIDRKITVYNEKDIDKEINKIVAELYLRNRKRARKYRY
ncbi:MAG: hypothetical protein ACJA0Q_000496 [Saprospiraceae bacterium]|jgi:uncharacterized protein YbaP (TraB family)